MSPQSLSLCLSQFELDFLSQGSITFLILILIFLQHYCLFHLIQLIAIAKVSCSWYAHFLQILFSLKKEGKSVFWDSRDEP